MQHGTGPPRVILIVNNATGGVLEVCPAQAARASQHFARNAFPYPVRAFGPNRSGGCRTVAPQPGEGDDPLDHFGRRSGDANRSMEVVGQERRLRRSVSYVATHRVRVVQPLVDGPIGLADLGCHRPCIARTGRRRDVCGRQAAEPGSGPRRHHGRYAQTVKSEHVASKLGRAPLDGVDDCAMRVGLSADGQHHPSAKRAASRMTFGPDARSAAAPSPGPVRPRRRLVSG